MRISATDIDDGNNSIVNYKLDPNSPDGAYFIIDPDNGVIFLNKTIDVSMLSIFIVMYIILNYLFTYLNLSMQYKLNNGN